MTITLSRPHNPTCPHAPRIGPPTRNFPRTVLQLPPSPRRYKSRSSPRRGCRQELVPAGVRCPRDASWPCRRRLAAEALRRDGSGEGFREESTSPRRPDVPGREQEVNVVTTRFGTIECSEADLIRIPEGLVGFRNLTLFVQLPDLKVSGLTWLQSLDQPEVAFGIVPPPLAVSDYRVELRPGDRAALELDDERSALVYVILNRADGGGLTVNLQGPLVFNMAKRLGRQLVLTSSRFAVKFPLDGAVPAPTLMPGPRALRASA